VETDLNFLRDIFCGAGGKAIEEVGKELRILVILEIKKSASLSAEREAGGVTLGEDSFEKILKRVLGLDLELMTKDVQ
jgi:hypothetical protein